MHANRFRHWLRDRERLMAWLCAEERVQLAYLQETVKHERSTTLEVRLALERWIQALAPLPPLPKQTDPRARRAWCREVVLSWENLRQTLEQFRREHWR